MLTEKMLDLSKLIIQTSGAESALLMSDAKCVNTALEDKKTKQTKNNNTSQMHLEGTAGKSQLSSSGGTVSPP